MRKKINNIFWIIILSLFPLFANNLLAQGGSNYSILGLGDINQVVTAGYESTSGTSIAMPSSYSINIVNPALVSFAENTRLQLGYRFNQNYERDDKSSLWQNNGGINGINIVFAFDTSRKIALALGMIPASKVNYLVSKNFIVPYNETEIHGTSSYKGSGGLSSIYLTLSSKIFQGLHLGGTIFGSFGPIDFTNEVTYDEIYNYSSYFNQKDYFTGLGYKLGLYYELPENLAIGAYFSDYGKLNVERTKTYGSDLVNDTSFTEKFSVNSPKSFGFGLSYLTGKFLIGADYKILNISNLNYGFSSDNKFKNSSEISFGLVRFGNPNKSADYGDRVTYKFGIGYSSLYYEIASTNINEMKLSFGMALPFSQTGILDLAFVLGQRGTTNNGLVSQYFGKMIIDFSIGEGWFRPFKREY